MRDRLARTSLRTRMVALAAVLVTVVLTVGGLLLLVGLRAVLVDNAVTTAAVRAEELATVAAQAAVPSPIPIAGQDEALVQAVIDGTVVASSENVDGEPPLPLVGSPQGSVARNVSLPVGEDDRFAVVSRTVDTATGDGVVHVAVSISEIDEVVAATGQVAAIGLPVLLVPLVWLLWLVVGRTLAPIEAIRTESDRIGVEDLHRRVPQPATHDEVGRLAGTMNAMLDRLEDGVERQRRFVGDAAHELRTPVATIRAQLETARAVRTDVDWTEVSDDLLAETLRMQRLTEQLLILARLDATTFQRSTVDLDDILVAAATATRRAPGTPRIDHADVRPVQVAGSPALLGQAVRNLLDNAARHAVGRVAVRLDARDGHAVLDVDDDGPGVPPAQRGAVLERFTRLDEARDRDDGGAGLGLAIVHDIVRAHGGTVRIDDAPGLGGARFTVRLPLGEPPLPLGR